MRCAVVCWGVLCRRGICGCVVSWSVVCRGVMGRGVVSRSVVRAACVWWHRYMVAVLHPCSGHGSASPYAASPGGGKGEIQANVPIQSNDSILFPVSFLSSSCPHFPLILLVSCRSSSCCGYKHFPNALLHFTVSQSLSFWICGSLTLAFVLYFSRLHLKLHLHCMLAAAQGGCLLGQVGQTPYISSSGLF